MRRVSTHYSEGLQTGLPATLGRLIYRNVLTYRSDGGFVVAYDLDVGSGRRIVLDRYDAFGSFLGETTFARNKANTPLKLSLTSLSDGGYAVTFESRNGSEQDNGIGHLVFNSAGVKIRDYVIEDGGGYKDYVKPVSAELGTSNGAYVTAYERSDAGADHPRIFGFDIRSSNGEGSGFVTIEQDSQLEHAAVALLDTGDFAVVWVSSAGVMNVRVFGPDGTAHGAATGIASGGLGKPSVRGLPGGQLAVTYKASGGPIKVSILDKEGHVTEQHSIVGTEAAYEADPGITLLSDGRFAVEWASRINHAIKGQIFDTRAPGETWTAPAKGGQHGGTVGSDHRHGGTGNDGFYGGDGADFLFGGDGHDSLTGGAGNDWLEGGSGEDRLDGGDGWDVVSYLAMPASAGGVVIDLAAHETGGAAEGDRIFNVEVVQGTNSDDVITGVDGPGVELLGEGGRDRLIGQSGADILRGGEADDTLVGGGGADRLFGGSGNNILEGGAGADTLDGSDGWGVASYEHAAADSFGNGVTIRLSGGKNSGDQAEGDNFVNIDGVIGSKHDDSLYGNGHGNWMIGGAGGDWLESFEGQDTLFGSEGEDTLVGGVGNDILDGGAGKNRAVFAGNAASHQITTNGDGSVTVHDNVGNGGTDTLTHVVFLQFADRTIKLGNHAPGEIGIDNNAVPETATVGSTVATLSAPDEDGDALTFSLVSDAGGLFELAGARLVLAKPLDYETQSSHTVTVKVSDAYGGESIRDFTIGVLDVAEPVPPAPGTAGTPPVFLRGTARADSLTAAAGDDRIWGMAGNDRLHGEAGNDRLYGGKGKDTLWGGDGQDFFVFNATPNKRTNLDKIVDFKPRDDTLWLDNAVFRKLGKHGSEAAPSLLGRKHFTTGDKGKDSNDFVIYSKKKGILYYDSDGNGAKAAIEIATMKKGLKMSHADFFVI
jgi:Ca2+-binding RTX toxin-like protein